MPSECRMQRNRFSCLFTRDIIHSKIDMQTMVECDVDGCAKCKMVLNEN